MDDLGTQMRDARLSRNLSVEDVARITKIPRSTLTQLEAGDLSRLPAPVFVRGFIRSFAQVVGADPATLVHAFEHAQDQAEAATTERALPAQPLWKRAPERRAADPAASFSVGLPVAATESGTPTAGLHKGFALLAVAILALLIAAYMVTNDRKAHVPATTDWPSAQSTPWNDEFKVDLSPAATASPAPRVPLTPNALPTPSAVKDGRRP